MKTSTTLILIGVSIVLSFIAGFLYYKNICSSQNKVEVITKTMVDTVYYRDSVVIHRDRPVKIEYDTVVSTPVLSIKDSIEGVKNDIEYKVVHSIRDTISSWQLMLKPFITIIDTAIVYDTTKVRIVPVVEPLPFYRNQWFWIALAEFITVVLFISSQL